MGTRKKRRGPCQRCGWNASLTKLNRRDRKQLQTDRTLVYLCNDCVNDLVNLRAVPTGQWRLKSVRSRNVA